MVLAVFNFDKHQFLLINGYDVNFAALPSVVFLNNTKISGLEVLACDDLIRISVRPLTNEIHPQ